MRTLAVLSATALLLTSGLTSASSSPSDIAIDCNKKLSSVEKRVCSSKELRELDSAMAETYVWAMSTVSQPKTLQRIHREWAAKRDQHGEFLPAAYKLHTQWLDDLAKGGKLDARLGRYAYSTCPDMLGANSDIPRSCGKPFENELMLLPKGKGRVKVTVDSMFMYGHSCAYEGTGTWKTSNKLIVHDDSELDLKNCSLEVTVTGKKAETTLISKDPSEPCRPNYCGMHGSLDETFYLGGQPRKGAGSLR